MANGLMKLTRFISPSSLLPRQWHHSSFSRLGSHEFLQVTSHSNFLLSSTCSWFTPDFDLPKKFEMTAEVMRSSGMNASKRVAVNIIDEAKRGLPDTYATSVRELLVPLKSGISKQSAVYVCDIPKAALGGMPVLSRASFVNFSTLGVTSRCDTSARGPCFARFMSSKSSEKRGQTESESKKEISTVEDPFDAPTYNIPEKPVTFAEGASYSFIILAGLGVAAAAGYAVFKELIFQPKEYKIFDKALKRIQDDSQVRVRIGSPITGYGQETRNRAARQRIPNRVWTDEDGVERVEVNFYIRGPHGAGKVYTEMFKDQVDKQWKFTYLIVEVKSPSPAQLILESYMPA